MSIEETRITWLGHGISRDDALNDRTGIGRTRLGPRGSPEKLFHAEQRAMRRALEGIDRRGVLLFAVSELGILGTLWLEATGELRAGSIGRHSAADLYLPDEELSLRHLAVLAHGTQDRVRVRVLDLRTQAGFRSELGERLSGVETEGPLVLGLGNCWLFCFPTGEAPPWRADAAEPWTTLPERRLLSSQTARPLETGIHAPRARREISVATPIHGPIELGPEALLLGDERTQGRLIIRCAGAQAELAVGATALERGILFGRYSRCDGSELFADDRISRVHALLVRHSGAVYLFDLGSTNGTHTADKLARTHPLGAGVRCELAKAAAVWWEPVH